MSLKWLASIKPTKSRYKEQLNIQENNCKKLHWQKQNKLQMKSMENMEILSKNPVLIQFSQ